MDGLKYASIMVTEERSITKLWVRDAPGEGHMFMMVATRGSGDSFGWDMPLTTEFRDLEDFETATQMDIEVFKTFDMSAAALMADADVIRYYASAQWYYWTSVIGGWMGYDGSVMPHERLVAMIDGDRNKVNTLEVLSVVP